MTPRGALAACVACLIVALLAFAARAAEIDQASSAIGFTLKTRWGKTLVGHFPQYRGEIAGLPDGRRQVRLLLSARAVEIEDSPTYTRLTRDEGFFDAERYPWVEFVSDPYPPRLLREGGRLGGVLRIRGVQRRETFEISPAVCARPAEECDVVARGSINRNDYGVDRWGFALSSRVVFSLRVRTLPEAGGGP